MDRRLRQPALRAARRAVRRAVRPRRGALAGSRAVAGPAPLHRPSLGRDASRALDRLRHPRRVRHRGPLGAAGRARRPAAVLGPLGWLPPRPRRLVAPVRRRRECAAGHRRLAGGGAGRRRRRRGRARRGARTASSRWRARPGSSVTWLHRSAAGDVRRRRARRRRRGARAGAPTTSRASSTATPSRPVPSAATCSATSACRASGSRCRRTGGRTFTDESWRQVKKDWLAAVEADVPAAHLRAASTRSDAARHHVPDEGRVVGDQRVGSRRRRTRAPVAPGRRRRRGRPRCAGRGGGSGSPGAA